MNKIVIIGGGAAGMMAAATIASQNSDAGAKVTLFEKNSYLGAKVLISGGGRCNVTTGIFDVQELIKNYPRGGKFLISAFHRFSPEDVMKWFEDHGVPLKIESDLRVFPKSDKGGDVVGALERVMHAAGVKINCGTHVSNITKTSKGFSLELKTGEKISATHVVIATGGNAYRHTGSTGDAYAWAQSLGHSITLLGPSLSSFTVAEEWISKVSGVSFQKVTLTLARHPVPSRSKKSSSKPYQRTGAFVFTHRGLSGPAIFALSSFAAYENITRDTPLALHINFFPEVSQKTFSEHLQKLISEHAKKHIINFLDMFLPKSLCPIITELGGIPANAGVSHLTKPQREKLTHLLSHLPLTVIGRSAGEEFVTAGGVELKEVDPRTMESKICPGLYFTGEILDIDGFTGGFNLQAAWATGRLAGEDIAKKSQTISR